MRHEELEELLPLYALEALDGEELRSVEAHLQGGCPRCEPLLLEFAEVAARLPESLPDVPVPPQLKRKVMDRIEQGRRLTAPAPSSRRRPWLLPWGAAIGATATASLLLWHGLTLRGALERERAVAIVEQQALTRQAQVLRDQLALREAEVTQLQARVEGEQAPRTGRLDALRQQRDLAESALAQLRLQLAEQQRRATDESSALAVRLSRREDDVARLQTQLREQERDAIERVRNLQDRLKQGTAELASLQGRLARQEEIIRVVEDPQSRVVTLGGLGPAAQASGKVIWQPVQQTALFYAYRLPPLPSDKIYQLWTITDRPISAGIFDVDHLGHGAARLTTIPPQVKTFAVTIEPAGGLPQPSGAIYLAGSL